MIWKAVPNQTSPLKPQIGLYRVIEQGPRSLTVRAPFYLEDRIYWEDLVYLVLVHMLDSTLRERILPSQFIIRFTFK